MTHFENLNGSLAKTQSSKSVFLRAVKSPLSLPDYSHRVNKIVKSSFLEVPVKVRDLCR